MIDPNQVWDSLSVQTEKLMSVAVADDLADEVRDDIAMLIDCALISRLHPQQIVRLIEDEDYQTLRELVYARAH